MGDRPITRYFQTQKSTGVDLSNPLATKKQSKKTGDANKPKKQKKNPTETEKTNSNKQPTLNVPWHFEFSPEPSQKPRRHSDSTEDELALFDKNLNPFGKPIDTDQTAIPQATPADDPYTEDQNLAIAPNLIDVQGNVPDNNEDDTEDENENEGDEENEIFEDPLINLESYHNDDSDQEIAIMAVAGNNATVPNSIKPPTFSGRPGENAQNFLRNFDRYSTLLNYGNDRKQQLFPLLLEGRALTWYNILPDDIQGNLAQLRQSFTDHFITSEHTAVGRRIDAIQRVQGPTESVDNYICDALQRMTDLNYDANLQIALLINNMRPELKAALLQHLPFENIQALSRKAGHVEEAMKCCYAPTPEQSKSVDFTSTSLRGNTQMVRSDDAVNEQLTDKFSKLTTQLSSLAGSIQNARREFSNFRGNRPSRGFNRGRTFNRGRSTYNNNRFSGNGFRQGQRNLNRNRSMSPQPYIRGNTNRDNFSRNTRSRFDSPGRPSTEVTCWTCGRRGHLQRTCFQRRTNSPRRPLNM